MLLRLTTSIAAVLLTSRLEVVLRQTTLRGRSWVSSTDSGGRSPMDHGRDTVSHATSPPSVIGDSLRTWVG